MVASLILAGLGPAVLFLVVLAPCSDDGAPGCAVQEAKPADEPLYHPAAISARSERLSGDAGGWSRNGNLINW